MAIRTYEGAPETRDIVKNPIPRNVTIEKEQPKPEVAPTPITTISGISIESLKKEPVVYSTGAREEVSKQIGGGDIFWKILNGIVAGFSILSVIGEILKPRPNFVWVIVLGCIVIYSIKNIVNLIAE